VGDQSSSVEYGILVRSVHLHRLHRYLPAAVAHKKVCAGLGKMSTELKTSIGFTGAKNSLRASRCQIFFLRLPFPILIGVCCGIVITMLALSSAGHQLDTGV
jgi:hypothetical protein